MMADGLKDVAMANDVIMVTDCYVHLSHRFVW